jgi:AAA family ATP:ADP antiporter
VYFMIEWIGSTMVGCFWAFVSSTTSSESAKKGYPLIIAGSQVGSILGSTLSYNSSYFGNSLLFGVGALALGLIVPMVFVYLSVVPENAPKAASEGASDAAAKPKKPKTGMLEGLKILMTRPYIIGILAVSTLYEIINTILEFEMNMLAKQTYATKEAFASFNGMYGIFVNCLALVFALLGTSFLIRRFGLRFCLMLFPLLTGALILGVYVKPALGMLVAACMLIKGLSYALNNPTKEMMYIPTSQDVRYKAKGWIDQFGARSSKGIGSYINNMFKASVGDLMLYGTLISLGLVGVWLAAAAFVGSRFNKLTENNEIVE